MRRGRGRHRERLEEHPEPLPQTPEESEEVEEQPETKAQSEEPTEKPIEEANFNAALSLVFFFRLCLKYAWIIAVILFIYAVITSQIFLQYFEFDFSITENIGVRFGFGSGERIPENPDYPYGNKR